MLRVIKVESKRWYYKFCEMLRVNLDLLQLLQNLMTALEKCLETICNVSGDSDSTIISYTKQYLQGVIDAFSHGSRSTHVHMRVVVKYLLADVGEFLSQ